MAQRPNAIGLLACERVIFEAGTNKITVVNRFKRLRVSRFPARPEPFLVFAILTDGQGQMPFELVIQSPEDFDEIFRIGGQMSLTDPLRETYCRFRVRNCTFPVQGPYHVSLLADSEPIASCCIYVNLGEEHE